MNKQEERNSNFDINAKFEDMIKVAGEIVKRHIEKNQDCEAPIEVCLAYDVKNYLQKLIDEFNEIKEERDFLYEQYGAVALESSDRAAERDRLAKRCQALENAITSEENYHPDLFVCKVCENYSTDVLSPCNNCRELFENWQFDEVRFGGDCE